MQDGKNTLRIQLQDDQIIARNSLIAEYLSDDISNSDKSREGFIPYDRNKTEGVSPR